LKQNGMKMIRHQDISETKNIMSHAAFLKFPKYAAALFFTPEPIAANACHRCDKMQSAGKTDSAVAAEHAKNPVSGQGELKSPAAADGKSFSILYA